MAAPDLEYVGCAVEDPSRSAEFFERALELPRQDLEWQGTEVPVVSVGDSALAFFALGGPRAATGTRQGVHHIAIGTTDPNATAAAASFTCDPVEAGLSGRAEVGLPATDTLGVRTRLTEPLGLASGRSAFVERIDHLGVASADNRAARQVFIDRLGCEYESEQTDSEFETVSEHFTSDGYPMVFHTRATELRGSLRVTFITVGDCELEFLQDLTVSVSADEARHDVAGNTRGDRSAIARYVARYGSGLHHVALKTPDIDRTLTHLAGAGYRTIDHVGRPGSRRARIGFVHPSATGGVLVHFVERDEIEA